MFTLNFKVNFLGFGVIFGFFFGFLMFSVFDEIFFCVVVGNYVFVFLNFFCAEKQL